MSSPKGSTINEAWHRADAMPPNAKFEPRAYWHMEQEKLCACRPIPAKLAEEMKRRGLSMPE